MTAFEQVLLDASYDCVMVFGDVNSTLACSIVAKKMNVPVAHVEAGLRSGDKVMPEEINRIVTDAISDFFFVTEDSGMTHLEREGKDPSQLFYVGHVMIDNLLYEIEKLARSDNSPESQRLKPANGRYAVVTLHRPSNVDDGEALRGIVEALNEIGREIPVIFPVHPRTQAALERHSLEFDSGVTTCAPLGYVDFLHLWKDAAIVLTDSGGLQEETTGLGVPCVTLRDNTERPITVDQGTNRLVGNDPQLIVETAREILADGEQAAARPRPQLWDGNASSRILDVLAAKL